MNASPTASGIFPGMSSPPAPEEVVDDLGGKILDAFLTSVSAARTDYDALRQWQPGWMTRFSQRFVANFIHERIWASMTERVDSVPDVAVIDKEPRREMTVSSKYIVRFKRHHTGDRISTYPTWVPVIDPNLPQVDLSLIETATGGEAK